MTFTDGYRVERVYFERLKSLITILKSLKDGVEDETVRTLIENAIDSDGAILLLYRNLGEAWAELADQVQKTRKMLQDLDEKTEKYHDELNERIDEVNNYLMALIRALEARMDAVEADLAQMGRLFTYDLNRVNDEYTLTESGQPVTWAGTVEKVQHVRPHFLTVRGALDGEVTYLMPREYDTAQASGIFEWYSVGFVGNEIHEVAVTLLPDDSVNVEIKTTDFAAILQRITALETRMTTAESDIDSLETRMTTAETDIDNLETEMDGKQDALTAGSGILLANNVISADTDVLQEKLVAGYGISIDPVTKEITNTAQGATYTAGKHIAIENNVIVSKNATLGELGYTYKGDLLSPLKGTYTKQTDESNYSVLFTKSADISLSTRRNIKYIEAVLNLFISSGEVAERQNNLESQLSQITGSTGFYKLSAELVFSSGNYPNFAVVSAIQPFISGMFYFDGTHVKANGSMLLDRYCNELIVNDISAEAYSKITILVRLMSLNGTDITSVNLDPKGYLSGSHISYFI